MVNVIVSVKLLPVAAADIVRVRPIVSILTTVVPAEITVPVSESVGVLAASGLIAGEALTGLVTATFSFLKWKVPVIFENPSYIVGIVVLLILGFVLIKVPLDNAGRPEDPAPPAAIV